MSMSPVTIYLGLPSDPNREPLSEIAKRLGVEKEELQKLLKIWQREGKVKCEKRRWYREHIP
jgi:predicted Rossmann fold nucleotide-binding protein DprA/Smf involved in DNA uptake